MSSEEAIRVRLVRGSYFGLLGTVVSVLGNFTASVILARFLGSLGLGTIGLYIVLGAVLVPLLSLSVPSAVARFVAKLRTDDPARLPLILSTSVVLLSVVGAFGTVFTVLVVAPLSGSVYGDPVLVPMIQIMGLLLWANLMSLFASAVLQGFEEFQSSNLIGGFSVLANVGLLLVLVPGLGLIGAVGATAGSVLVSAGGAIVASRQAIRRRGIAWRWRASWAEARSLMAFVGPLNAASILTRIAVLVQNSLVAIFVSFVALGYLRVAGFLYNAILFLPRTLIAPMLPILTSMAATRQPERKKEIVTQIVKILVLLFVPLSSGLIMALRFAIELFYGPEFGPAFWFGVVLIASALAAIPNGILGEQYLVATGRTTAAMVITLLSAGISLASFVLFLSPYDALALPMAAFTSEFSVFALLSFWLGRRGEFATSYLVPSIVFASVSTVLAALIGFLAAPVVGLLLGTVSLAVLATVAYFVFMSAEERGLLLSAVRRKKPAV